MLKFVGAMFVTAASLLAGWGAGQSLSHRLRLLRQLRLALEVMQGELELNMPPLSELFESVGKRTGGEIGDFFLGTGIQMAAVTGRPPQTAMKLQLEEYPLELSKEEKAMLMEMGGALGRYDLGGQARALGLYRTRVDRLIETAEADRTQKGKAWMTASVCSGLMLILLML